jgi:hypothetical protein
MLGLPIAIMRPDLTLQPAPLGLHPKAIAFFNLKPQNKKLFSGRKGKLSFESCTQRDRRFPSLPLLPLLFGVTVSISG